MSYCSIGIFFLRLSNKLYTQLLQKIIKVYAKLLQKMCIFAPKIEQVKITYYDISDCITTS